MAIITGTDSADVLAGTSSADSVYGLGGDDQLYGGAGSDYLLGGTGFDTIYGGSGNDTIDSGIDGSYSRRNVMFGDDGNDYIKGGDGFFDGGTGADTLEGMGTFVGGQGDDVLTINPYSVNTVDNFTGGDNGFDTVNLWYMNRSAFVFSRVDDNLVMSQASGSGKTTFKNWYLGSEYQVEKFIFSGSTENASAFNSLSGETTVPPAFTIVDSAGLETLGSLSFNVKRSGNTAVAATVDYATSDDTAVAGSDYVSQSGTITFAAGQIDQYISISLINDKIYEPSESFRVTLNNPSNKGQLLRATAVGTITDDDPAPVTSSPNFSIADSSTTEGGVLQFTVTRGGNTSIATYVNYATNGSSASSGSDFVSKTGRVSFAAGETSQTVDIATVDDGITEATETMTVSLNTPGDGGSLLRATAIGTILDNEAVTPTPTPSSNYRIDITSIPGSPILWVTNNKGLSPDLSSATDYVSDYPNSTIVGLGGAGGSDNLTGNSLNNVIWGNIGNVNDTMTGGAGTDMYYFGANEGQDVIAAAADNLGDEIGFYDVYNHAALKLSQNGTDLVINAGGTGNLTVKEWYNPITGSNKIDSVVFADGYKTTLSALLTSPTLTTDRIVFASDRDGDMEIYTMSADGTNLTQLTNNSVEDNYPSLSPDGTKVAFTSERDGDSEIYVMDANGTNINQLTNNNVQDIWPGWSPDSNSIIFTSNRDGDMEVYSMLTNGTNLNQLTNNTSDDFRPSWSPDGKKVAFTSDRDGDQEVFVMNTDGTSMSQLTNNTALDAIPTWSPDGTKLAFSSDRDGDWEVYTMNVDGTNLNQLTNNSVADYLPSWSPDGKQLTFTSNRDGDFEIYTMNVNGTSLTQLTNNSVTDIWSGWGGGMTYTGGTFTPTVIAPF